MVFQASNAGAWSWDLDTDRFVWSDENFQLLGFQPAEIEPGYDQWFSVIYAEDQAFIRKQVQQAIDHQSNLDFDYRVRLQNGSMRWLKNSLLSIAIVTSAAGVYRFRVLKTEWDRSLGGPSNLAAFRLHKRRPRWHFFPIVAALTCFEKAATPLSPRWEEVTVASESGGNSQFLPCSHFLFSRSIRLSRARHWSMPHPPRSTSSPHPRTSLRGRRRGRLGSAAPVDRPPTRLGGRRSPRPRRNRHLRILRGNPQGVRPRCDWLWRPAGECRDHW